MGGPWMAGMAGSMGGCCGGHSYRREHITIDQEVTDLEELQRDLEEAAADVAERIRRLKEHEKAEV